MTPRIRVVFLIASCVLLFFASMAKAQNLEGEIRYLAVHNWTKKMAALDYLTQQQREKIAYMWGNRSEWKVYTRLYFSERESKYEDSEEKAERDDDGYSWRKDAYTIKRNFADNTMVDVMTVLGKNYIIEDTLQMPNWKILNDMKEVAGHICMNAFWEDTLKQQQITVWFALDLPVPAGPERLCGLPGIILEADVNNGALTLTADKIELKPLDKELDLPKKLRGKRIRENDYRTMLKNHMDDRRKAEEPWFWAVRY